LGDEGTKKSRSSVKESFEQIITDLTDAASLLPAKDGAYMGGMGAKGMLARVYFHMGEFAKAEALCTEIINSGLFSLNADVADVANKNSTPEVVFEIVNSAVDNPASIVWDFRQADNSLPRYWAGTDFVNQIYADTTDKRLKLYVYRNNKLYVAKWDRIAMNIPVIRLAEVYLTRSECRAQQGNTAGAIEDANKTRERAGLKPLAATLAGNSLFNAIRKERNIELAFEGDIFLERKRQRRNLKLRPWNDAALIFKIPDIEVNANTLCTQNP
jgi:tetratricopeptide (TPR) repeat protein